MSSAEVSALIVDELVRIGVREAVLCPGSRDAPLAYALHRADEMGRLRLHVRIDERGAGFLALGMTAASGRPVPVVTTSGTAAANLHPAMLEASHRGLPLVAITADRPPSLVGTGANQTTDQTRLFGTAVRSFVALDAIDPAAARPAVDRLIGWATGALSRDPGPVHLNVALREPLVGAPVEVTLDRRDDVPATALQTVDVLGSVNGPEPQARTLILAGGGPGPWTAYAALAAERRAWPVVAELSAGFGVVAVPHGALLLGVEDWVDAHAPTQVVVVGNPTLHRSVQRLLSRPDVDVLVVSPTPRWPDAAHAARRVVSPGWLRAVADLPGAIDPDFKASWLDAGAAVAATVSGEATGNDAVAADSAARVDAGVLAWPNGAAVARTMFGALPDGALLQAGSSNPVRDLDLAAAPRADVVVIANRGLAGIDGTLSSAVGAALTLDRPAYALVGDLTFLHDLNGLLIGPSEPRPDLTVVVCNDDGGGIFATLEQGKDGAPDGFERLFGTPTGASVRALATGVGATYRRCESAAELVAAVNAPPSGITVVEVPTSRADRRAEATGLQAAARHAVSASG